MSEVKWIKIVVNIFDDEKMFAIETLPDGQLIELVWFKILCLAGKCNNNGFLLINNKIPYTDEMLASVFRMEIGTVKRALEVFENLEMIEVVDNAYMVSNWLLHQHEKGLEEIHKSQAERQKRYRERQRIKKIEEKENVTQRVTSRVTSQSDVTSSYSYSLSKSNVFNLNCLLDTKEEYVYLKDNIELLEVLKEWLEYKDAKGKQHLHYAEISLEHLIKKFIDMNDKYGTIGVTKAVHEAIAQGWQGIVWEKAESKAQNTTKGLDWDTV